MHFGEEGRSRSLDLPLPIQDRRGWYRRRLGLELLTIASSLRLFGTMTGLITSALLFIGPAYFANAGPLVLGGGAALDGGRTLADGQPIFGPHKTVRGVIAGIVAGTLVGLAESLVDSRLAFAGFMISLGAVLGDLLGAFIKRRLRVEPGRAFPVLDQLDFIVGGLVLGYLFFPIEPISVLLVVLVTPPVHLATNYGAYRLGIKKTQW